MWPAVSMQGETQIYYEFTVNKIDYLKAIFNTEYCIKNNEI